MMDERNEDREARILHALRLITTLPTLCKVAYGVCLFAPPSYSPLATRFGLFQGPSECIVLVHLAILAKARGFPESSLPSQVFPVRLLEAIPLFRDSVILLIRRKQCVCYVLMLISKAQPIWVAQLPMRIGTKAQPVCPPHRP